MATRTQNSNQPLEKGQRKGSPLQEELAAYLHIRQGQLSKIERGMAAPSIEVLILLSDRFRKRVDWILRGEGN